MRDLGHGWHGNDQDAETVLEGRTIFEWAELADELESQVANCSAAVLADALRAVLSNPMGGYAQAEAYSAARSKGWAALAQYDGGTDA